MTNPMHAGDIVECKSVFVGPCMCGPAIHINLSKERDGPIFATAIIGADECDELVRQIKNSAKAVRRAA